MKNLMRYLKLKTNSKTKLPKFEQEPVNIPAQVLFGSQRKTIRVVMEKN